MRNGLFLLPPYRQPLEVTFLCPAQLIRYYRLIRVCSEASQVFVVIGNLDDQ
jgi:hypothetical protein